MGVPVAVGIDPLDVDDRAARRLAVGGGGGRAAGGLEVALLLARCLLGRPMGATRRGVLVAPAAGEQRRRDERR